MDEKSRAFLTEGLRVYPEACRAIRSFYEEVGNVFRTVLCEKDDWTVFHPERNADTYSFHMHDVANTSDLWIAGLMWGTVDGAEGRGRVELGLWWESPAPGTKLILYANFPEPKNLRTFNPRTKDKRAKAAVLSGKTRVFIAYNEPVQDIATDANLLLDLLQAEVRPAKS